VNSADNDLIDELRTGRLKAYEAASGDIREHFGIEETVLAGGYGYRQILELVQNGADAILEAHEARAEHATIPDRMEVLLRGSHLYVANTGAPLSRDGVESLLRSHSSPKRGNQIGRFGLGFKSLLGLQGKIDVFSSTFAFRFDPERCRKELRDRFGVMNSPGLRLAWRLEGNAEADKDPTLASMAWATTVVRAEISADSILVHLRNEIRDFPSEFLLFLPVPIVLTLDDGAASPRTLTRAPDGTDIVLHDAEVTSCWRVVERLVSVTNESAKKDATHIHARESVPLTWAIPLDAKREEAGRFWAFFPTHTPTRLPGILNAPWKLNSDRNAIIGGEWNTTLMCEAARLVADTLPSLANADDPGRPLDAFPRQLERKDEDAAPLIEALWSALTEAPIIPDGAAIPRKGIELWRHPMDHVELAGKWLLQCGQGSRSEYVHSSCYSTGRTARLNELAQRLPKPTLEQQLQIRQGKVPPFPPSLGRRDSGTWFRAVASIESEPCIAVLHLAEAYSKECKTGEWDQIRPALAIIPSQNGKLLTANDLIIASEGMTVPGREVVATAILADTEGQRLATQVMQVKSLDDRSWRALLDEVLASISYQQRQADAAWKILWARVRAAPEIVRNRFIADQRAALRVRRRDGAWVVPDETLLPGDVIQSDDPNPQNRSVLVDDEVHQADYDSIKMLGIDSRPHGERGPGAYWTVIGDEENYHFLKPWLDKRLEEYRTHLTASHRNPQVIHPLNLSMPAGWTLLPKLSGTAKARLTRIFLDESAAGRYIAPVEFGHPTQRRNYPTIAVSHPFPQHVRQYGAIAAGQGTLPLTAVLARLRQPILRQLGAWPQLESGLSALVKAIPESQQITPSKTDIRAMWSALFNELVTYSALAGDGLRDLWSGAAQDEVVPEKLPSPSGDVPLAQVLVTESPDLAQRARAAGRLVVTLDPHALRLWRQAGARSLDELLRAEWRERLGPPVRLVDAVPEFASVLSDKSKDTALSQAVSDLSLLLDDTLEPIPCLMWREILHLDPAQLGRLARAERLERLLDEISSAGWLKGTRSDALEALGAAGVEQARARVGAGTGLAERLSLAVGNRVEPLLEVLGHLAARDGIADCSALQAAEIVLAMHGPTTLQRLATTLKAEGLRPPDRWGTVEARAFVGSIGFPEEFAASPMSKREAEEAISGPIFLPPLHDYQEEVVDGLEKLIAGGSGRRRAVVSLPTGSGKTRVTVQSAVNLVLKPESASRRVIWVAQTDELCEQAVQAFRQVWINCGADRTDLRVIRLWGGHSNPSPSADDEPTVVVASIQTLNNRVSREGLDWLSNPGMVVIDECHHAITKSYSALLKWLDAEYQRPGAEAKDEPPIIGLSATPFRGTDDTESLRLARRFDQRWLPSDQAGLYNRLLSQGVLAHSDHEALPSPTTLLDSEIEALTNLGDDWESIVLENLLDTINRRLARDEDRNSIILDRICASAERSMLFFASSVDHAREMAVRLHLKGVPAAAVSGDTAPIARRYFLDRFQRGEIRVLCNHSVLTAGFDAPKTDMVLIARQVFSPVRYMQMVGRGLRGEKNGGTARCRIVTVLDNLGRFSDKHPYHFCARYFGGTASVA